MHDFRRVGDRVIVSTEGDTLEFWQDPKNWEVQEGYAAIVRRRLSDQGWSDRVVGFVRLRTLAEYLPDPEGGPEILTMKVWRLANESSPGMPWVAPRNASALFDGEQVDREELEAETFLGIQIWSWDRILRELSTLRDALRAPGLVR